MFQQNGSIHSAINNAYTNWEMDLDVKGKIYTSETVASFQSWKKKLLDFSVLLATCFFFPAAAP